MEKLKINLYCLKYYFLYFLFYSFILFFIIFSNGLISPNYCFAQNSSVINSFYFSMSFYNFYWNNSSVFNRLKSIISDDSFEYSIVANYNIIFKNRFSILFLSFESTDLLDYNYSTSYSLKILQLWARINIYDFLSISFGRKVANWDDCYFESPSDMINEQSDLYSLTSISGRDIFEILGTLDIFEIPIDFDLILLFNNEIESIEDNPLFLCVSTILYPFQTKIKLKVQNKEKPKFASFTSLTLDDFQIYYDLIYFQESEIPFIYREVKNYFNYVIGLKYETTFLNDYFVKGLTFVIEYFHRDDGLTVEEGNNLFATMSNFDLNDENQYSQYISLQENYHFFKFFKNYLYLEFSLSNLFKSYITFLVNLFLNIDDQSFLYFIQIKFYPKTIFNLIIRFYGSYYEKDSETSQLPYSKAILLLINIKF